MTPTTGTRLPGDRRRRRLMWISGGYALILIGLLVVLWCLADDWVPATILAYSPRWVFMVPAVVLLGACLVGRSRVGVIWGLVSVMIVLGPLTDGRVHIGSTAEPEITLVTANMQGGSAPPGALREWLAAVRPDVVGFQETPREAARNYLPAGYQVVQRGSSVMAAKHDIEAVDDIGSTELGMQGFGGRFRITMPLGTVTVVNLHLPTPRGGFEIARHDPLRAWGQVSSDSADRGRAMTVARQWVGGAEPAVFVLGDFNTPVESRHYVRNWGGFVNGFSDAGTGWGATKFTRTITVRIDHVLAPAGWNAVFARVGPDVGSDHRPVVAGFRRSGP